VIIAIIQARMRATRFPGKVLKIVEGIPLLGYQINRIKHTHLIDRIVVATSVISEDDQIAAFCEKNNVECFRGSENDVLSRYYDCAKKYKAEAIVRLTADCPFSDPKVIDDTIMLYQRLGVDYAADTIPPESSKFPDGFDVEVFSMPALERANQEAKDLYDREHVTFYFWKYDNGFKTAQLGHNKDYSKYRLTLDYPEDFEVIKFVIQELEKKNCFGSMVEIIEILDSNPEIKSKNSQYYFGIGWKK